MPNRSIITARTLLASFKETRARRPFALTPAAAKQIEELSRNGFHKEAIDCFGKAMRFYGTVGCDRGRYGRGYSIYANTGETYDTTLTYSYIDHCYRITSWGDLVEWYERKGVRFE